MDNASAENLEKLRLDGERNANEKKNDENLTAFAKMLIANK